MNMQQMLKQAQQMQKKMQEAQEKLKGMEVTGQAGGGVVTATVNGQGDLLDLDIDPEVVDPDDVEMLQDLILSAVQSARETADDKQSEIMPDMGLPGGGQMPDLGNLLG